MLMSVLSRPSGIRVGSLSQPCLKQTCMFKRGDSKPFIKQMLGSTPGDQTITFRLRGGSDDLPEQVPD